MSNYISATNQQIIWNTVNRIPAFMQLPSSTKETEFNRIMEAFYRENVNKPVLSLQELQELNRKTVLAFLPPSTSLHKDSLANVRKPDLFLQPNPNTTAIPMVETRQEQQERAFQERQNMYAQMNEKPNLPSPDIFKEKEEDSKITNMDELIENYQKQRNLVVPPVSPAILPTPAAPAPAPAPTNGIISNRKRIQFLEGEVDPKSLNVQDMEEEKGKEKKNLSWKENLEETRVIEDSYLQELEKRITKIEQNHLLLLQKTEEMEERFRKREEEQKRKEDNSLIERKEIKEIMESLLEKIDKE